MLSPPLDTALTGWLPFGDTWQTEGCGPGEVVIGFYGYYEDYLNQVGERCGRPTIVENAGTTPHAYTLNVVAAANAPARGGVQGTAYSGACPAGKIVVGISGMSGSWIDQLSFTCAAFELVDLTPPAGPPSFTVHEVPNTRALVGLHAGGTGGAAFDLQCPTGQGSSRLLGALGSVPCCPTLVTTLGLSCHGLQITPR